MRLSNTLKTLTANKNDLSWENLKKDISNAVSVSLETLTMEHCKLGSVNGTALAEGILKNPHILNLSLRHNALEDKCAAAFGNYFQKGGNSNL